MFTDVTEETAEAMAALLRRLLGSVSAGDLAASPRMVRHLKAAAELAELSVIAYRAGLGDSPITRALMEEKLPAARGSVGWYAASIAWVLNSQAAQRVPL